MRQRRIWLVPILALVGFSRVSAAERPNILWITCEDTGPQLGCYGDHYATTPNLDALAARGMVYLNVWSTAPVCAPARTAIISGMYPSTLGAEHMRSEVRLPAGLRMYPQFLRDAGYYCSNNNKEDYNLIKPGKVWDDSSSRAHWKHRQAGQPFFAIFNHTMTHESQVRLRPHRAVHDPAAVRVPAYHPDTSEVRTDWAQYYDQITEMDAKAGENLKELADAGLAEDTIVFFYGDHGAGMPRSKRWLYESGLHVPLLVYVPARWRSLAGADYVPGGRSGRLVAFVDLAPTVLSLAAIPPPDWMQGRAFLGPHRRPPPSFLYGLRGRMDERIDLVRAVRDERFLYIRNFMPHRRYGQHLAYMFETPTTQVWQRLYDEGKLTPPQTDFWRPKPAEELYDVRQDPDQVRNLVGAPEHQGTVVRLRQTLHEQILRTRDLGLLPEAELHTRTPGGAPYDLGGDETRYPLERILRMAELASALAPAAVAELRAGLTDEDSAVRYWAAMGFLMRGSAAVRGERQGLRWALTDSSPSVRVAAGEALARHGTTDDLALALPVLVELANYKRHGLYVALAALNAIDELDEKAAGEIDALRRLPRVDATVPARLGNYVDRILDKTFRDLGAPREP
jgi:uncharacterized sulfatase